MNCAYCLERPIDKRRGYTSYYCNGCWLLARREVKRAAQLVAQAVRKGKLPRLGRGVLCIDCKELAFCYDHRDYGKPLQVDPVCFTCNKKRGPAKHIGMVK